MRELLRDPDAWTEIAAGYEQEARALLTPFSRHAVDWAGLGPDDDVLDVACGPGTTTLLAAPRVRSVHARDFSRGMIAELEKNARSLENVTTSIGDGQRLDFDDGRFNAAFSMFGLMFFPDPHEGLCELHRVLKPDGQVFISSWVPMDRSPRMKPMIAALQHAIPPQPDQEPPPPFAFSSAELLADGLREGGFEDVEVREVTPTIAVSSPEAYWAETRGNIIVNHIRKLAGTKWPDMESGILDHLRGSLTGVGGLEMPAFVGRGRKRSSG